MSEGMLGTVIGPPMGRHDPVEAAYEGMNEEDRAEFRRIIQEPSYGHAQIASALRVIGYDVDRKQVFAFREKLAQGKVKL